MSRFTMLRAIVALSLAMTVQAASAHAGWMWDTNADKLDDRMARVELLGPAAAHVGDALSGKLRFALMNAAAPYRYGVYVGYDHHPGDTDAVALAATGAPVQVRYESIDYIRTEVTFAQAQAIALLPGVTRVETMPVMYAVNDVATRVLRARPSGGVHHPSVWGDAKITGKGVVVGILDSGVNDAADPNTGYPGHQSLRGKWVGGGDFAFGQPELNTPLDQSINPRHNVDPEVTYHGTHVAGTAIGSGGPEGLLNGGAPGEFAGMAPDARLVDCKVLSDAGTGLGSADGLDWCIHNRNNHWGLTGADSIYWGINVINMSVGGSDSSDGSDANSAAVNAAHKAGIVVCVASGNDGFTHYMPSPAAADFAITVGAFVDNNTLDRGDDGVTDYSNEGPRSDDGDGDHLDEMKPVVCGSGTGILSALGDPTTQGDKYHHINGTSMACPTIAGVCALILQANPSLTPDQVREVLKQSADHRTDRGKLDPGSVDPYGLDPNYHPSWGWGQVDAYAAVLEAQNMATTQVTRMKLTPLRAPDRVQVDWTSQREIDLFEYQVDRAPDAYGVPGAWTVIHEAPVSAQHPEIQRLPNRHTYSYTDASALDPAATYWYRIRWVDFHNQVHNEPPLSVRIMDNPAIARVKFSWTHDYSDGDLVVKYGSGVNTNAPAWYRFAPGAPAADSVVNVGGVAYTGTLRHYFHFDLTAADLVGQFLPPSANNPWFLSVKEGGYVNTVGKVDDFSVIVFNGATSTTYASPQVTTPNVEKQETVFWIPLNPVTSLDHAPVLAAIGPKTVAEGLALAFTVTASDPDGDAVTRSATGLPAGATFNASTGQFAWTPGYAQAGSYNVTFGCSAGSPLPKTDSEVVTITVTDRAPGSNLAPVLEPIGDRQVITGETLSLRVMGRDPESQALAYSLDALPGYATFDGSTGILSWTPRTSQVGTHELQFTATDPGNLTDQQSILVTVSQAGVGPTPPLACEESGAHSDGVVGMGTDPGDKSITYIGFDVPSGVQRIEGQLSFALAPVRDLDFYLMDADSNVVGSSASVNQPETIVYNTPAGGHYIWQVIAFTNPDTAHFAIDQQVCSAVTSGVGDAPVGLALAPAWPNPTHGSPTLRFSLPQAGDVSLRIHDVAGRSIRVLQRGWLAAGAHTRAWDRRDDAGHVVAAGLYFVRFEAGGRKFGEKVILLP